MWTYEIQCPIKYNAVWRLAKYGRFAAVVFFWCSFSVLVLVFYGSERVGTLMVCRYFFYLSTAVGGGVRTTTISAPRSYFARLRSIHMVMCWRQYANKKPHEQKKRRVHIMSYDSRQSDCRHTHVLLVGFGCGCREKCVSHRYLCAYARMTLHSWQSSQQGRAPYACVANMSRYNL